MVAIDAQNWLTAKVTDWKNAKQIYGTKDGKHSLDEKDREFLIGDLVIENLNGLEELDLYDVRELNKVVIKNCSELRRINLLHSGVKQLEVGPGMDRIEELSIGFEINSASRPIARKLDKIDLSKITNLKTLRCVGVQETELIGFEKLTQLELFCGNDKVKIPTKEFRKWKENLDIITVLPNGLDLLKGGSGLDKDDVDLNKLNGYKNRPIQDQSNKELNKIKGLLGISTNDSLPADWETKLVKKSELDIANQKNAKRQEWMELVEGKLVTQVSKDWRVQFEITNLINKIEQQLK